MEKEKNSSDKQKNSQWIWPGLITLVVFGSTTVFVIIAAIRDLSSVENVLLQFIFLSIGCGVSYSVGKQSVEKAAKEIIKPHARSAFRRLLSLYQSLSRAATTIESAQISDSHENDQVALARLEEIITEQLSKADDALEDWRDIVPEDVEELEQKRQFDNTRREEQ